MPAADAVEADVSPGARGKRLDFCNKVFAICEGRIKCSTIAITGQSVADCSGRAAENLTGGEGLAMSEFNNVTIVKKANVYFDGKVTSRSVIFADGSKKTLGIMLPGEYEFGTADKELMEIMAGELEVLLPGENSWKTIKGGESFNVPANAKFGLRVKTLTDYCCSFLK